MCCCSILFDIKKGQQRVALKYLESEAGMLARLGELATLRATFQPPLSKEPASTTPTVAATGMPRPAKLTSAQEQTQL